MVVRGCSYLALLSIDITGVSYDMSGLLAARVQYCVIETLYLLRVSHDNDPCGRVFEAGTFAANSTFPQQYN